MCHNTIEPRVLPLSREETLEPRALPLSREETLALLDLCLNSAVEMQPEHEGVLIKLGDLARSYMTEEINGEAAPAPIAAPVPPEPAPERLGRVTSWTRAAIRSRQRSLPS